MHLKPITHEQALNDIVAACTVTILSYEEAILFYLRARSGCQNDDVDRFNADVSRARSIGVICHHDGIERK